MCLLGANITVGVLRAICGIRGVNLSLWERLTKVGALGHTAGKNFRLVLTPVTIGIRAWLGGLRRCVACGVPNLNQVGAWLLLFTLVRGLHCCLDSRRCVVCLGDFCGRWCVHSLNLDGWWCCGGSTT